MPATSPGASSSDPIQQAADILASGGLVVFPTDTVYGLGVDPLNADAVERLFRAKRRQPDRPLPLLLSKRANVDQVAAAFPPVALRLARAFWPGSLTLVVPAHPSLPAGVTAGTGTVGLRVPDHPVPRALAAALGRPITGTSANASGQRPHVELESVMADVGRLIDYAIPGECGRMLTPSTVVDCTTPVPTIVRSGAISRKRLAEVVPAIAPSAAAVGSGAS